MANPIDVTNPGLVNVANQGYDFLPVPDQPITVTPEPRDDGVLISPSSFAPTPPLGPLSSEPPDVFSTPAEVNVNAQPALPPSFSMGTPEPEAPEIFVDDQDAVIRDPPVAEFVVTEVGSLQINDTGEVVEIDVMISAVLSFGPPEFEEMFKITVTPAILDGRLDPRVQVTMLGRQVDFVDGPNAGQTRIIVGFSGDFIVVNRNELGSAPLVELGNIGSFLAIAVDREASEVFFKHTGLTADQVDVNVSTETLPEPAVTVVSDDPTFLGNFDAGSGVVKGFVGEGEFAPPFQGTFQVADQSIVQGLAANVFVS